MEMTVLILILVVQTIVVAWIGYSLISVSRRVKEVADKVEQTLDSLRPKAEEVLTDTRDLVKSLQPIGEQLVDVSLNLRDIMENAKDTSEEVADFIRETTQSARRQISQIDNLMTDTVKKTEEITQTITQTLINPLGRIASLFKGFRAAFDYFRGNRYNRPEVARSYDEDMFI